MKKLILISLMFVFSASAVFSQDLIYTISGQFNDDNITLDSILFENITNDSKILFYNLPENPDYQINLTEEQYWGTTGISYLREEPGFVVLQNIPGKLTLRYSKNTPINVNASVYNINGQKVYTSGEMVLHVNDIIRFKLETVGVFIVKLESPNFIQSFKSVGGNNLNIINVDITAGKNPIKKLKSTSNIKGNDFGYEIGDSLKISAFKNGYFAPSTKIKIENSQTINLQFNKNYFKINDNEYLIAGGLLQNYSENIYSYSYLTFVSTEFNLSTFESDGMVTADEPGAIVDFDLVCSQDNLPVGTYYLSNSDEMNTELVCDEDYNNDGIINNDDCYYKLPDGKFYISSDNSIYDTNFDINGEDYEPQFFIKTGAVSIKRESDFYTVEFDCVGENGDILKGYFRGHFLYFNYEY